MCPTVVLVVLHHCWGLDGIIHIFVIYLQIAVSAPQAANLNCILVVEFPLSALLLSVGFPSGFLVGQLSAGRLG